MTADVSLELFKESIPKFLTGDYQRTRQSSLLLDRGSKMHYRKEIGDLKRIDLSWPKEKIARRIRATWFPPYDPPFYIEEGKRYPLGPDYIQ